MNVNDLRPVFLGLPDVARNVLQPGCLDVRVQVQVQAAIDYAECLRVTGNFLPSATPMAQ